MTQAEVYYALAAIPQPAKKQDIAVELKRQGIVLADISDSLGKLVKNQFVKIHYRSHLTTYEIIAPFPERNVINAGKGRA